MVLLALLPAVVAGQPTRAGRVTLSVDTRMHPAFQVLGGAASVKVLPSLSAFARVRQVWGSYGCTELSPTPCSANGFGGGLGVHLAPAAATRWWPYVDLMAGAHRYTDYETKPFGALGAGIGWYLGPRGHLRIGFQGEWIQADPAYWDDGDSVHVAGGLVVGFGFGVG